VFFVSQLGKYMPGSVWPIVMQMEAGRPPGGQPQDNACRKPDHGIDQHLCRARAGQYVCCHSRHRRTAPVLVGAYRVAASAGPGPPRSFPFLLDRVLKLPRWEPLQVRMTGSATMTARMVDLELGCLGSSPGCAGCGHEHAESRTAGPVHRWNGSGGFGRCGVPPGHDWRGSAGSRFWCPAGTADLGSGGCGGDRLQSHHPARRSAFAGFVQLHLGSGTATSRTRRTQRDRSCRPRGGSVVCSPVPL